MSITYIFSLNILIYVMGFYKNYLRKFKESSTLIQLLIFIIVLFLIGEVLEIIIGIIFDENFSKIDFGNSSLDYIFFEVVLLAPLIETFLIQFLILELLILIFSKQKNKFLFSVILSGLIFGILHQYNIAYMIATTIIGWIFGFIYVFYKESKKIKPFLAVLIVHSVYNFIILVKDYNLTN